VDVPVRQKMDQSACCVLLLVPLLSHGDWPGGLAGSARLSEVEFRG